MSCGCLDTVLTHKLSDLASCGPHTRNIRYRRPTLYHAKVLLLPLRPRGVRMQYHPRAADIPLAQTTCALKPIVERGGERLVRVRVT